MFYSVEGFFEDGILNVEGIELLDKNSVGLANWGTIVYFSVTSEALIIGTIVSEGDGLHRVSVRTTEGMRPASRLSLDLIGYPVIPTDDNQVVLEVAATPEIDLMSYIVWSSTVPDPEKYLKRPVAP